MIATSDSVEQPTDLVGQTPQETLLLNNYAWQLPLQKIEYSYSTEQVIAQPSPQSPPKRHSTCRYEDFHATCQPHKPLPRISSGNSKHITKLLTKRNNPEPDADIPTEPPLLPTHHLTAGSIYHRLGHRFLARRIIARKPTIVNRYILIDIPKPDPSKQGAPSDQETLWLTCPERLRKELTHCGIELSYSEVNTRFSAF